MSEMNVSMKMKSMLLTRPISAVNTIRLKYITAFKGSLEALQEKVKAETPVGVSGKLMQSIRVEFIDRAPAPSGLGDGTMILNGAVASRDEYGCSYAAAVELGSLPHWPPSRSLVGWVGQRLEFPRGIESALFLVGRHISKHGTKAPHMFEIGKQKFENENILGNKIEAATNLAVTEITR